MAIVSSIKCPRCLGSLAPDEVHENEADCLAAGWKKPVRLDIGEVRSDVHYPATGADVRDES
jgi:hypothetical protein